MLNSYFPIDIKGQILVNVEKKFNSAKLLQNQTHHETGKSVIDVLLKSKEIKTNVFRKYFKDAEKYSEVLKGNVFAYHPARNTITFQSKSIGLYSRKHFFFKKKYRISVELTTNIM